jgi:hypothetical protein
VSLEQPKKEQREMSREVKALILTFQKIRSSKDENEQLKLIEEFHTKLLDIVTPDGENLPNDSPERLKKVLDGREMPATSYISVGSGTDGQRIWVQSHVIIENQEDAERLGKDAKSESVFGNIELESVDGRPRWLKYNKPEGTSWPIGKRYWERYIEKFGNPVVDLLQEIK